MIKKKKTTKKVIINSNKRIKSAVKKPVIKKKVSSQKNRSIESNNERKETIIKKDNSVRKTKVRVIGLGGGGGSIVSEISGGLKKASFVIANTDKQALKKGNKVVSFSFGETLTGGLGTGMNPELGREAALIDQNKIEKLLKEQDLCVFVSCLGGGTGCGAIPVFAKTSKDLGNLTYGIFTLPFKFEGERKMEMALDAIDKSRKYLDALTVIPNEKVFGIVDKNTPLREVFSTINRNLIEGLEGLIEMIYEPGIINIDFADLQRVLENQGKLAYLNNIQISRDKFSVDDLVKKVISNPLYSYSISGAKGILLNISGEKDLSLMEVDKISRGISELVSKDARIIFGISQKSSLKNKIGVSLLATGCSFRMSVPKKKDDDFKPIRQAQSKSQEKKIEEQKVDIKEENKEEIKEEKKTEIKEIKPIQQAQENPVQQNQSKPKKKKITKKKTEIKLPKVEIKEKVKDIIEDELDEFIIEEPRREIKEEKNIIKKNGLQLKQEVDEAEARILAQEKEWDIPAFMRKEKKN